MENQKVYYGVVQSCHGHDHVWLFTDEQIQKEFTKYNLGVDHLPQGEETTDVEIFWPYGGSNVSSTKIVRRIGEEAALSFLTQECWGPDSDDPMLVDLAEYLWTIEEDGCAKELLESYGHKCTDFTQHDSRVDNICLRHGLKLKDFYSDKYGNTRYSEWAS